MTGDSKERLSGKERGLVFGIALICCGAIAFLFYDSAWGMLWILPVYWLVKKKWKEQKSSKSTEELRLHFMNGLQVLEASLQAGYSMENAWKEVEKESRLLYGENSVFYQEIREINQTTSLNQPIEKLFCEFAYRSGVEEMVSFAEVLEYGKRNGGDWKRLIADSVLQMLERFEAQKEIEVMLAEKRMEQMIMNVMPLGMLLFLRLFSWEYLEILYGNIIGVLAMSVCLAVYVAAVFLSEKIMDIQV